MSSITQLVQGISKLDLVSGNGMASVVDKDPPFAPADYADVSPHYTPSSRAKANGFNVLPGELRNKVFKLALTADDSLILMPCLSGKAFKPNVATALLRVCKQVHREARGHLYTANTVVIDNFGADLESISRLAIDSADQRPSFRELIFDVGDAQIDWEGFMKTGMFANGLMRMRHDISVDHLKLEFRSFCFGGITKPEDFAAALGHIKVLKNLTMSGPDYLWEEGNMRAVPQSLDMRMQPASVAFIPRNNSLENTRIGYFSSTYRLAENPEEVTSVVGGELLDAGVLFDAWCSQHDL